MSCDTRKITGSCQCHRCAFIGEAPLRLHCVDLINERYCLFGYECLPQCPFSYTAAERPFVSALFDCIHEARFEFLDATLPTKPTPETSTENHQIKCK